MLLTSWVRSLRHTLFGRRSSGRVRRQTPQTPAATRQWRLAETLEERALLSALVIDGATFTSTSAIPGINITNTNLDADGNGVSDYDNLVIASSDAPISITGAGTAIKINLTNLTGLKHITIENVNFSSTLVNTTTAYGIDIDLSGVPLESLTLDRVIGTVTSGAAGSGHGVDINLQNITTPSGVDVTVKDSTITSVVGQTLVGTGLNVTLGSTSAATHVGALTIADSTLEGIAVTSTAGAGLQTLIDDVSVKNVRVQTSGVAARDIRYSFTRTTVDDLRVEENPLFRSLSVAATNSPLHAVTIADNPNIDLTQIGATTTGIAITASSNNFATSERSDITNLRVTGNSILGNVANANTARGIVLTLADSNLGRYVDVQAGTTISGNVIRNLSTANIATNPAVGLRVTASATAAFVADNAGNPLLLDFAGDANANDFNGIVNNVDNPNTGAIEGISGIEGRGIEITTTADTTFQGDLTGNSVLNGQQEGVVMSFTDRPTNTAFDSFALTIENNDVTGNRHGELDITMINTAIGAMTVRNNQLNGAEGVSPDGLSISLVGTNVNQVATNLLRKSFIDSNSIGITSAGGLRGNVGNGIFVNSQEASEIQDLHIRNNVIRDNNADGIVIQRDDESLIRMVNPEVGQSRAITISGNTIGQNQNGIVINAQNGGTDVVDAEIIDNYIGTDASLTTNLANTGRGIDVLAALDARVLVDVVHNEIRFNTSDGVRLQTSGQSTDKRQVGGSFFKNTFADNAGSGIFINGRHGLVDETTNIRTPIRVGLEGVDPADGLSRGNVFQNNGQWGFRVESGPGDVSFVNNHVLQNDAGGVRVNSSSTQLVLKDSIVESNQGIGVELQSTGTFSATVRGNLITEHTNIAGGNFGDGVQIDSSGGVMSVLMTDNFIDSNQGRGIDVLNRGNATLQIRIGDGTAEGTNTLIRNGQEGLYVVNTSDGGQSANVLSTAALGAAGGVGNRPDMMIDVDANVIQDNGQGTGGGLFFGIGATGMVLRAGTSGSDGAQPTTPGQVGTTSGDAAAGNGRVNSRVLSNTFGGNSGDDFFVGAFLSTGPGNTGGTWDTNGANPAGLERDPLVRINMVFTGNTGDGIDVQNGAAFSNNEPVWKSRTNAQNPPGPFGSGTRGRSVTNLRGAPVLIGPGLFSFAFEGLGASTLQVETGFDRSGTTTNFPFNSPTPGNNFDDTGLWNVLGAGTFNNPISFPNVASPSLLTADITVNTDPSPLPVSQIRTTFSEYVTGVNAADFQLLSHTVAADLTSTLLFGSTSFVVSDASVFPATPFFVRVEAEEMQVTGVNTLTNTLTVVRGVNGTTQVPHNGTANDPIEVSYIVPLVDALNVPIAVVPDVSTEDPNNPGAYKSFTMDISFPTATAGNYELRLRNTDAVTPVRDVLLQPTTNLGNTLVTLIDSDGVLQDYATFLNFTVDNVRPVASITPVTPDPRNSAAGIVTVTFPEAVTGVDIADFTLTRDGNPVSLSSVTPTQVSSTEYTLNLNQLTGASGNYVLRVVSTDLATPILDAAGNLIAEAVGVGIAAEDSWTVDIALPTVTSVVTVGVGAVSNVPVSATQINFSEAVSGVSIGDLNLTRTDAAGNVTSINIGAIPLFQLTPQQYELDLSSVSNVEGTYTLTVNAVNSGIFDLAGNAFESSFSASWVFDSSAPSADIVDVAPDPRTAPVDALNTIFSQTVTGLTIGQYVLSYDDGTLATSGSITNATNAGPIVITSVNHGLTTGTQVTVYGIGGNTAANGIFTVTNLTANTFSLDGSAGNGLYTSGGRWARTVALGASTLTQQTPIRWVANLATITNSPGVYIVSLLSNAGAIDAAGNPLTPAAGQFNVAAQDIWTYGPDVAPIGTITALPPSIGTNAGLVTITFSEPLLAVGTTSPVDLNDFRLRRNAVVVPLTGAVINQTSATTFTLDLTAAGLTDVNGNYELSLLTTDVVTPIRDLNGNPLQASFGAGIASQITWTKIAIDPSVTSIRGVFTDATFDTDPVTATKLRAVQNLTINFSVPVNFTLGLLDASQYFRLTRQALTGGPQSPVSLEDVPITRVTSSQYRINLSSLTGTDGNYVFTVLNGTQIQHATIPALTLLNSKSLNWTKDSTIRPNQLTDATDAVGSPILGNEVIDSSSVTSGFQISLRAAVQEANALAGDDVIELGVGTYVLTLGGVQEDFAVSGDLDIRENLTIRGKGVGQTIIDASGLPATQRDRIFQVLLGATLNLQGVTLRGGAVLGSEDGGAIKNSGVLNLSDAEIINSSSQDDAGAINNAGTATITRTTIANNTAVATGGAIRNTGTLTITDSTISGNTATSHGGGLMNVAGGTARLEGVTLGTNRSTSGAGGGIRNDGTLTVINNTIAFNSSLSAGAGISSNLGSVNVGNTILSDNYLLSAGNPLSDVAGTFNPVNPNPVRGNNIVRTVGAAVGFGGTDQLGVNPGLLGTQVTAAPNVVAPANFGGPTLTYGLPRTSTAIDRGNNAISTATTDQRGAPRRLDGPLVGNAIDIGAVEFGTFFVNTTADTPDVAPNDGLAADGLGNTSLRAAIMEANALAGENAIMLNGQTYNLSRTAPDTTAPTLVSITGVPATPFTTGSVGAVTITFSEAVGGVDITDFTLTRSGANVPLTAAMFTKVSDTVYQVNLTTVTGTTNGVYQLSVVANGTILDAEGNAFVGASNVVFVRGTDTFAPTAAFTPVATVFPNAGTVRLTFNERINSSTISLSNFALTRNAVAVPLTGVPFTVADDPNFNNRTVVTLNLASITALDGAYSLTMTPTVGATTVRDVATTPNNMAVAPAPLNWNKVPVARIVPVTPDPRVGAVSSVTLEFSEAVSGVQLSDFAMTYDDLTGIGAQPVDLSLVTLAPVSPTTTPFGQAAQQWTLTFANNEAARDGNYVLTFNGTALLTVAGAAFAATAGNDNWSIGENLSAFGDLDVTSPLLLQIIGIGADAGTNSLGVAVNATVIDALTNDRLFDVTGGSRLTVSGVEMRNGRVVLERSGGAIRNLGILTINSSDVLSSFADGNGGAISNGNFSTAGTLTLNSTNLQNNSAGSATSGTLYGKGGAIFNDNGSVTITDGTYSSNAAYTDGGVIYNDNNTSVVITAATLSNNTARGDGGALYNGDTSSLTISSTTLSGNRADLDNDGNGEGGAVYTEASAILTLNDSILQSNQARVGGALYNDDATLNLADNIFAGNRAFASAGAIYNSVGGTLTLSGGLFSTNDASDHGGAIQNFGVLNLSDTEFLNNEAGKDTRAGDTDNGFGGAIYNQDGTVTITDVEFTTNHSYDDGGAIYNESDSVLTLTRVTLVGNTADGDGGAVYNNDFSSLTVDQSTFSNNSASGDGGGLYNNSEYTNGSSRSATIAASTFNNNSADNGGAIFNSSFGGVTIENSTISTNSATISGGGIANYGTASLLNATVYLNNANTTITGTTTLTALIDDTQTSFVVASTASYPTGQSFAISIGVELMLVTGVNTLTNTLTVIRGVGGSTAAGHSAASVVTPVASGAGIASNFDNSAPLASVSLLNTIVAGGTNAADLSGPDANFADLGNNLIEDVGTVTAFSAVANILGLNPQLDALQDNGGATFTHALLFGSPARDQGNNTGTTTSDQRGFTRIFDGDGNGVATVDIGAYESGFIINSFADTVDENINDGINADENGVSTLRATVMQANARPGEDTIILSPGTYTLTLSGRNEDAASLGDLDITDSLNIIGSGADQTFIDGGDIDRIFQVFPGVTLNLSNLTLLGGNASTTDDGGSIFNQGTVTLDNVIVRDNTAARGGGIYNDTNASLTVTDSTFTSNVAVLQGGAVYNRGTIVNLLRSDIGTTGNGNRANTHGGGLFNSGVVTAITESSFTDNVADSRGGGIYNATNGNVTVLRSTFNNNFASSRGAALYNEATLAIRNTTISNNDSGTNAALANTLTGAVTIVNSTVVDNVAYRGGGLATTATGSVSVQNTILANNVATTLTGIKASNARGTFVTAGNNFIGNNENSVGFNNGVSFDQVGSSTSPFDPVIEDLSDNGGPTLTHAPRIGSPAIDAGNNTGGDTTDQRGAPRPTNDDSDIGAVEREDIHLASITDVALAEGNSGSTLFRFTLTLNQTSVETVRIGYALQGDSAFVGEDFINASGTVVFTPGTLIQTITVEVNGDTSIESTEQFFVNLLNPVNVTLDDTRAVGTIIADDTGFRITDVNRVEGDSGTQTYTFDISLVGATVTADQSVDAMIAAGTATAGVDFVLVPGTTTYTFAIDNLMADITAGATTLNVISAAGFPASAPFTIQIGSEQMRVTAISGTQLTVTRGFNNTLAAQHTANDQVTVVSRSLNVTVNSDPDVEANETFFVNLTASTLPFEFGKSAGVGVIFNDDLAFTITGSSATEADAPTTVPLTFTVALQQPVYVAGVGGFPVLAPVAASVSTAGGTATSGQDFTAITNQLVSFAPGTNSQTVTATILGDLRYEVPSETFTLQVTSATINGVNDPNAPALSTSGTGTIVDNDPPPDEWRIITDVGATRIEVYLNNVLFSFTADFVNPLSVSGDDEDAPLTPLEDDLFIVDFTNGNPIPSGGLNIDGRGEVGADTMQLVGGGTFNTVEYFSIDPNSGSIVFDGFSTVNYTGLEPILDQTLADNRTFNAPAAGNDNIVISSSTNFTTISSVIGSSSPTFENVTFRNPTTSLTVNANAGNNNIQISGGDATFTSSLTVNAGDGNDTVNGTSFTRAATLNGGLGGDTITGGTQGDVIDGGDGADSIFGGNGDDTIFGQAGNDTVFGGEGADQIDGGINNDSILGENGVDQLLGGDDEDYVDGGAGSEVVLGGNGNDIVLGGGDDDTVVGGDGNDQLFGGTGNDSLDGGFGDDTMSGDSGNDSLNGDVGSDVAFASADEDQTIDDFFITIGAIEVDTLIGMSVEGGRLVAGAGDNTLDATNFTLGSVTLVGGMGSDTLTGSSGDDVLVGGLTNDFTGLDLTAITDGADVIDGGVGRDTINAQGGNDTVTGGDGDDCIQGGAGVDSLDGGNDNDSVQGQGGVDVIHGGNGIDTLDGGDSNDTLFGDGDGDSLLGGAANDSIEGGDGEDTIDGGDGNDVANGGIGNDSVGGGMNDDTLSGGDGDDTVNGNDGNDTLNGNAGFDTLFGGAGDDLLISTEGNDELLGQGGTGDRFTYDGDAVADDIFTITPVLTGIGLARLNLTVFELHIIGVENFTLNLGGGNNRVTFGDLTGVTDLTRININGGAGADTIDGSLSLSTTVGMNAILGAGNDSVQGTAGNDTISGDAGLDTIFGNSGNDSIVGGNDNDSLNGNLGLDTILGQAGNDSIQGGGGNDSLSGDIGLDTILGQAGNDSIDGGDGNDFLDGGYGAGTDTVTGTGNDTIRGGAGADQIAGRDGADSLFGDVGNDTIKAGADNDTVDGGIGLDLVDGGDGNDSMNGGADNDWLLGGNGNDSIFGGAGNDVCVGGAGDDSVLGQGGTADTVLGGSGTGTNTRSAGDRVGQDTVASATYALYELFKISTARPNLMNELNF